MDTTPEKKIDIVIGDETNEMRSVIGEGDVEIKDGKLIISNIRASDGSVMDVPPLSEIKSIEIQHDFRWNKK